MRQSSEPQNEMFKGTLDMMVLRTLVGGDAHGQTIAEFVERTSEDFLEVEQGSSIPRCTGSRYRRWVSSYGVRA